MDSTNYIPPFEIGSKRISLIAKEIGVGTSTIVQKISLHGIKIENNPNTKLDSKALLIVAHEFNCYKILGLDNYLFYAKKLEFNEFDLSRLSLSTIPNSIIEIANLKKINLSHNHISDYSILEKIRSLQSLDLSSNQISDYSFLSNLMGLKSLDLSSNQISDISFLSNLTGLKSLYLNVN